ncbi:MAG TPA: hypothetical protein VIM51_01425 [Desulfosporosinus sp.]
MNIDEAKREVSASELGHIKDKYPQMAQNFEEVKKQAYQPQTQGLAETQGQPAQPHGKFFEQEKWQDEGQADGQGQTS